MVSVRHKTLATCDTPVDEPLQVGDPIVSFLRDSEVPKLLHTLDLEAFLTLGIYMLVDQITDVRPSLCNDYAQDPLELRP